VSSIGVRRITKCGAGGLPWFGDMLRPTELSGAWCFADEASEGAWAILELQAAARAEGVPLLPS